VIVTTGGEAELGAVGGGVSPEPLEDDEPCVTPAPPLVPAADFVPLVQAVASTATIVAEAASRVTAARRHFPPLGRTADVRMKRKLLV
jgi:hypothetical protein